MRQLDFITYFKTSFKKPLRGRLKCRTKLLPLILAMAIAFGASAKGFSDEALPYRIMYKWGLVNKQAGSAVLSLKNRDNHYHTVLTARSQPWADKFYMVRDTLKGVINPQNMLPLYYERIAHEGDDHAHDIVRYSFSGSKTIGDVSRVERKKDEVKTNEKKTLESDIITVDMLSSFYYMRTLPYTEMSPGNKIQLSIFSGKCKENLAIKYVGKEDVKLDNVTVPCYHITFKFTSDNKTKSSDDMDAWISADDRRIPIKLEGKLKIGKVQCFYTGTL